MRSALDVKPIFRIVYDRGVRQFIAECVLTGHQNARTEIVGNSLEKGRNIGRLRKALDVWELVESRKYVIRRIDDNESSGLPGAYRSTAIGFNVISAENVFISSHDRHTRSAVSVESIALSNRRRLESSTDEILNGVFDGSP